jgi:hypothetical protein
MLDAAALPAANEVAIEVFFGESPLWVLLRPGVSGVEFLKQSVVFFSDIS